MFASLGFRLHLHCLLGRGGRDDLSKLVLDAPGSGCLVDNPDNSLFESISLFEGLRLSHPISTGTVELVSVPSRDRQQPC